LAERRVRFLVSAEQKNNGKHRGLERGYTVVKREIRDGVFDEFFVNAIN
jgi:hypothetical protein